MKYLVIGEDGDAGLRSKLTQEDLANFDQSTVTNIFRFTDTTPFTVEQLESINQEDADEDTPEDEQCEGQVYTADSWREVAFGG